MDKQDSNKLVNNGLLDRHNDIYRVNGKGFVYRDHPINLIQGQWYRIYLTNMLDFDLIDSFNLNGMMFNYIRNGTTIVSDFKSDVVTQTKRDKGILEFQAGFKECICLVHLKQNLMSMDGWVTLM